MNIGRIWKKYIPSIVRDSALLSVGSLGSSFISLLAIPVLSRIYTPAAFGVFAIFLAIVSILRAISTGRYEMAIPLTGRTKRALCLLQVTFINLLLLSIVLYGALLLGGEKLHQILNVPELRPWMLAIPIVVAALSVQETMKYWFIRERQLLPLAQAPIIEAMVRIGVTICLGLLMGSDAAGLLAGALVAQLLSTAFLLNRFSESGILVRCGLCSSRNTNRMAVYYARLPVYSFFTTLPNAVSNSFLPIALSIFFGATSAGLLMVTLAIVSRPTGFAVAAVWNVSYGRLAETKPDDRRLYLIKQHLMACFIIAIPMSLIAAFADLAGNVLGEEWASITPLLPAFAVMVFFNNISNLTSFFSIFALYKAESFWNIFLLIFRLTAAALLGFLVTDATYALIGFAAASAIAYLAINVYWGLQLNALPIFLFNLATGFLFIMSASWMTSILVHDLVQRAIIFVALVTIHSALYLLMRRNISRLDRI